ncbi:hypothetical protein ACIBI0_38620 [Microbispora rosea]|uniref:hypothetical protein n=1 Tax=Microbispora rosea TaxID=58117 RepID=UPI0037AE6E6A
MRGDEPSAATIARFQAERQANIQRAQQEIAAARQDAQAAQQRVDDALRCGNLTAAQRARSTKGLAEDRARRAQAELRHWQAVRY